MTSERFVAGWSLRYVEHRPSRGLEEVVECFWEHRAERKHGATTGIGFPVLPDGCIDFVFRSDQDALARGSRIVGAMTHALHVDLQQSVRFVGVRFRPGAAAWLLGGLPACELTDVSAPLVELWKASVVERCAAACFSGDSAPPLALFADLEQCLLERLASCGQPPVPWLAPAVERLRAQAGSLRVGELSRQLGLTRQHLNRVFQTWVGLSPKQLARVFRLRRLLAQANVDRQRNRGVDWCRLAFDFGYCDQAHLSAECRTLTGQSPGQHLAGSSISPRQGCRTPPGSPSN